MVGVCAGLEVEMKGGVHFSQTNWCNMSSEVLYGSSTDITNLGVRLL